MNEPKSTVLIADDEARITDLINDFLIANGYNTLIAHDGETAIELYSKHNEISLIILDIMMPEMDGWQVCREIRKTSNVPIMLLTARSEEFDQLMGFESGADDYVTKPFNILTLKARVRALLRRASMSAPAVAETNSELISCAHISLDEKRRSAFKSGEEVVMTMKEFDLILFLMKNPGKVYSRESLLDLVWGYDYLGDTRTVDVHIRRLREKLELDPAQPQHIITKWGVGYYFAD